MRRIQLKGNHNTGRGRKLDAEPGPKKTAMESNRKKVGLMCERR